jgi:hypothetical protein
MAIKYTQKFIGMPSKYTQIGWNIHMPSGNPDSQLSLMKTLNFGTTAKESLEEKTLAWVG